MNQEIIKKIKEEISKNIFQYGDSYPKFSDSSYKPFEISEHNFHNFNEKNSERKIAFIDGGNLEIINAANLSLSLIRVYSCIYENNKRIKSKRQEFYALVYADNINNEINYRTEIFSKNEIIPDKDDLIFNSFDITIKIGNNRAEISRIGEIIRRFAELKVALEILHDLKKEDILILDGSLRSTFTNENKYLENLYQSAKEKNILIAALSKTSSLMTDKGNSLIAALGNFNKEGKWYYYPVVDIKNENHKANIFFVKLHEYSEYIFKFESYKEINFNPEAIFGLVASNCKDPIFLGYPYALIEADRFARIQENEKEFYITTLMMEFGDEWKRLKPYINTKNAHSILDNIS